MLDSLDKAYAYKSLRDLLSIGLGCVVLRGVDALGEEVREGKVTAAAGVSG
jgi:hypothetical protein